MELATGSAGIEWPISAGVVPLPGGGYVRICLDGKTLLGPEAAHLSVGGRSGAAAKTSYVSVLLKAAMAAQTQDDKVAALIFNVKGSDLCFLDQEPVEGYELSEEDLVMYEALGIPAEPFQDVTVYAPSMPGGTTTRSQRLDAIPVRWGLKDTWSYLRNFNKSMYENENQAALLDDIANYKIFTDGGYSSLNEVIHFLEGELEAADGTMEGDKPRTTIWRNHHVATARRILKLIAGLPERTGGLVAKEKVTGKDIPVDHFAPGEVKVVDISGLEPIVQGAVVARTLKELMKSVEAGYIGVDHIIVFVDELNIFAPQSNGEVPGVKDILAKIAATGRYAGVSLWGAAQFLSQVHNQVRDNSATQAFGVLAEAELDSGVYGRMPTGQRERVVTLPKGAMVLRAYNLRGWLTVLFPRPAWRTGMPKKGAGLRRMKDGELLGVSSKGLDRLTEGLDESDVARVVARHDGDTQAAVEELERLRTPDMRKVSVEGVASFDPDDPWDLS
jgi:hypothetical protein